MASMILSWILLHISSQANADCAITCDPIDDDLQDVIAAMSDLEYSVDMGHFEIYDSETSDTYIPFARDDTDYLIAHFDDTGFPYTRFGGQDAVLFRTCTPFAVTYMGYRSYSAARIKQQTSTNNITDYTVLEASLGDTLNQKVINTESSDETLFDAPWDRKTNIVTTGDEQTWTDIVTAFANVDLLTEMSINLDAINNGILSGFGLGRFKYSQSELEVPRDTLSIVYRIQFDPNSECNKELYLNQSFPFYRFYKDESKPRCAINHKLRDTRVWDQKCENTHENKYYFDKAVANIIDFVTDKYGYKLVSNQAMNDDDGSCQWWGDWWPPNRDDFVYIFKHGYYCILYQKDCMFDNRDTYYSWDGTDHTLGEFDYYLIVGLNHNNYSMSMTNSVSISTVSNAENGNAFEMIDTVTNEEYQKFDLRRTIDLCKRRKHSNERRLLRRGGSGFHSHQNAHVKDKHDCTELKDVFAVQFGRKESCVDGIADMCVDSTSMGALGTEDRFIFFGEATLNPVSKTMPDQDCIIEWRVLKFDTRGCNYVESGPSKINPFDDNAGG